MFRPVSGAESEPLAAAFQNGDEADERLSSGRSTTESKRRGWMTWASERSGASSVCDSISSFGRGGRARGNSNSSSVFSPTESEARSSLYGDEADMHIDGECSVHADGAPADQPRGAADGTVLDPPSGCTFFKRIHHRRPGPEAPTAPAPSWSSTPSRDPVYAPGEPQDSAATPSDAGHLLPQEAISAQRSRMPSELHMQASRCKEEPNTPRTEAVAISTASCNAFMDQSSAGLSSIASSGPDSSKIFTASGEASSHIDAPFEATPDAARGAARKDVPGRPSKFDPPGAGCPPDSCSSGSDNETGKQPQTPESLLTLPCPPTGRSPRSGSLRRRMAYFRNFFMSG